MTTSHAPVIAPVLGRLIRQARIDAALTQTQVADALEAKQSTVSNWETGKQRPKITQFAPLSAILGIDRDALIAAVDSEAA